jgi:hypothetical protein
MHAAYSWLVANAHKGVPRSTVIYSNKMYYIYGSFTDQSLAIHSWAGLEELLCLGTWRSARAALL